MTAKNDPIVDAAKNNPIVDAMQLANEADKLLKTISLLERQANDLAVRGGKQETIAKLNGMINQYMINVPDKILQAKIKVEYAQSKLKKTDPNFASQKTLSQLNTFLSNLDHKHKIVGNHVNERILRSIKTPKTDPMIEILKDAPKPSSIDPNMNEKVQKLIAKMFDQNNSNLLKDRSVATALLQLDSKEKRFFFNELAKKTLNCGDHVQLNALKALNQMSMPSLLPDRKMFIDELMKENKVIALEILKKINVPNTKLPTYPNDDMLYTKPAPKSQKNEVKDEFQKRVMEAADGGFGKVKEELSKLPKEQRLDFIVAVREEVDRRKLEKSFNEVKVPTKTPRP